MKDNLSFRYSMAFTISFRYIRCRSTDYYYKVMRKITYSNKSFFHLNRRTHIRIVIFK